ncbi:ArnT family glycosyltransferase [Dyadobacter luticola]|uniref:Glycosyl transferase n=1 Tax=Dyadobacter luticola TaxID=1979387 RepID=A0A5R9L756_9BACT|nr:glycosyltransferase family 39 protein [Dyadobacter luticola]TLV04075.1 glycosyl transferase [Dyadobacter luticola]
MNDPFLKRYFPWLLLSGIVLNIPGLFLDILEPDGALYATLARHIAEHNDWVNLFGDGHDWLDKPHFPFWMAALSYKILGINSFAYKLPAFIFWLISLRYTYLLGRDLYDTDTARMATLIYAVAFHSTLNNFDVRAEPYLTACIIASTWHMLVVYKKKNNLHIIWAALFAACAITTKGIFVLLTIAGGWVIFWILTRQFKEFLNYRWWLMLVLTFLFILPELYTLYVQFDLHPEKVVFGKTNVSGLRFFFWDSQFGRFFNTGPIKGRGSITFFLHTTLWAFLPWSLGLVGGLFYLIRFDKNKQPIRWVIYGSTLLTFLLFSLSKFQLPHYLVILFPYFALITAYFFSQIANRPVLKTLSNIHTVLAIIALALVGWLQFVMDIENGFWVVGAGALVVIASFFIPYKNQLQQLLFKCYTMAAVLYLYLFVSFYPFLLTFQSGRQAARAIPEQDKNLPVAAYGEFSYTFEFYSPSEVRLICDEPTLQSFISKAPCYLYTTEAVAKSLLQSGLKANIKAKPKHFHITRLKYPFLNKKTRSQTLETRYLLFIN